MPELRRPRHAHGRGARVARAGCVAFARRRGARSLAEPRSQRLWRSQPRDARSALQGHRPANRRAARRAFGLAAAGALRGHGREVDRGCAAEGRTRQRLVVCIPVQRLGERLRGGSPARRRLARQGRCRDGRGTLQRVRRQPARRRGQRRHALGPRPRRLVPDAARQAAEGARVNHALRTRKKDRRRPVAGA